MQISTLASEGVELSVEVRQSLLKQPKEANTRLYKGESGNGKEHFYLEFIFAIKFVFFIIS
jgi:hypothetical protein